MAMKVFLATNNDGKIERFKHLLTQVRDGIEVFAPKDLNIEPIEVEENGKTLEENAVLKAKAYLGKVDMPIVSNDTGFWVEGEGFVPTPKRSALGETDEKKLSKEEVAKKLLEFWKAVATKHGGKVDAAWIESFVAVYPNGEVKICESRREIILTDQEFGTPHIQMPVRALYISKITNKPAIQETEEEEFKEMFPVIDALKKVLGY
jgi:inosine/xanthosine triphosphate pyrophosphatase family protein